MAGWLPVRAEGPGSPPEIPTKGMMPSYHAGSARYVPAIHRSDKDS